MKLTKRIVDAQKPTHKAYYKWDSELSGFGIKVLPSGKKTYLVQYRIGGRSGRTRRMTIGRHGVLTAEQARAQAKLLLGQVATGLDPATEKDENKTAISVDRLLGQFFVEHVEVKLKKLTQENYEAVIRLNIPQSFKRMPIEKVSRQDVARLHFDLRDRPYAANKTLAVLSKFFNWCEKYGHRPDHTNPCRHVDKYREVARQRFLSSDEQKRLGDALNQAEDEGLATPYAIRALKLLSLTGARLREILDLKWEYVDFERGVIELPTSKTGAKTIYLNPLAIEIIESTPKQRGNPYVICGLVQGKPINNLQKPWIRIRKLANLDDVRIHDLRHTFASVAVNGGMSLPMIGALLGHTQPATTARYAHLAIDPLKRASELVSEQILTVH
jgi:integrase